MIKIIQIAVIILLLTSCTDNKSKIEIPTRTKKPVIDNSQKVILITIDGLRWQELFSGADSLLVANTDYVKDTVSLKKKFWNSDFKNRRKSLMPFFWNTIAKEGAIYGNRKFENMVNITNKHGFSYPGYSEILCGFADDERINSNDKNPNPNVTVLEYLNNTEKLKGEITAFASWDVFPYIINEERSGVSVNAGFESVKNPNATEKVLNKCQSETHSPWHNVRLDVYTHNYALEYLKKKHPKLLYVAYGETDDFGHDGRYDFYLDAAKRTDNFIKELWDFTQQDPFYKNNTTFVITTDHGRGSQPLDEWKSHGYGLKYHGVEYNIKGSEHTWIALLGNKVQAKGEVKIKGQLYNSQIATTVAYLLGQKYKQDKAEKNLLPLKQ